MPRPRLHRRIAWQGAITHFKPAGTPLAGLEEVELEEEHIEAMRLKDVEGLSQHDAAERMGISQPTFHRILAQARTEVARALSHGLAIRINKAIAPPSVPPRSLPLGPMWARGGGRGRHRGGRR